MMISKFALLGALLIGTMANAQTMEPFAVQLNDGSVGHYKLLPAKFDPAHNKAFMKTLLHVRAVNSKLPPKYAIPSQYLPEIRDQGQRGTCAYFATVGITESWLLRQNTKKDLSPQCLVTVRDWMADTDSYTAEDKPVGYRPDPDGDWPRMLGKTIELYGVPEAKQFATADCTYSDSRTDALSLPDYQETMASGGSEAYGKGHIYDLNKAPTIDSIKELLNKNVPVEIGVLVYNAYFDTSDWAFSAKRDTDDQLAGGHAVQLVGYVTKGKSTVFTFKNSWGTSWGKSGYGTIDDKLLQKSWSYDPEYDMTLSLHD